MFVYFKLIMDILIAFAILLLVMPLLVLLFIVLLGSLRGNPIFTQLRPGKNNELFTLYKFRTMTNEVDDNGILLPDDKRMTIVGKIIRSFSFDELPQLFNILKGSMSFVGPRPLLPEYLPLYSSTQIRRHEVKPGITGWAQVNGRNSLSWEKKFELDVWYVDNQCFLLDVKILCLTVLKVLKRDGVTSNTSVTMEKFKGSKL